MFWLCLHVALSVFPFISYIFYFWSRWYVQMLPLPVLDFESQLVTKINAVILKNMLALHWNLVLAMKLFRSITSKVLSYCVLVASKKHCLVDDRSLSVFPLKSIFPLYHVMLVGKDDDPSRCSLLAFLPANQVAPSPNAGLSLAGSPPRTPGSLYSTVRTCTVLRWISVVLHCGITAHRHFCSSLQQISWALRVSGVVGHCVVNAWNFCKLHCVALLCPALPECTTFPCLPCFARQSTC